MECLVDGSYDWFKEELIRAKVLADGPVLHFVASIGAVSSSGQVSVPQLTEGHGRHESASLK